MAKSFLVLVFHLSVLVFFLYSLKKFADIRNHMDIEKLAFHFRKLEKFRNITTDKVEEYMKSGKYVGLLFFTMWTFTLQIIFLLVAVMDETSKLVNMSILQKRLEKCRTYLFSSLVLPSSLLVATIFWSIWHIDRELIFPKAIDDFYPSWLNHTLHTFILIPLIVELMVQINNENFRISKLQAGMTFLIYCTIYQSLYMFVYFKHGVWLYPIYKILSWTQRVAFTLFQLFLAIGYQQIAILILNNENKPKIKLNID